MEEKQTEEKKQIMEKAKQETEKVIEGILDQGINEGNLDYLYKVVDIHKDIANEEYWKEKIDMYNEGSYGNYGRGSYGEGSYNESYNRRGMKGTGPYSRYRGGRGSGRYREGEDMMEEMKYSYGAYSDGNEYGENYRGEGTKELEKMLDYNIMLIEHLKKNAKNQEERQVIEQKQRELSEI